MSKPRLLHLFNSFEVGGVERQHMMLVDELTDRYDQECWSYFAGPIQDELDALSIPHRVGEFDAITDMVENGGFDCIVLRTNRYMREMADYFNANPAPIVYIRSFLRWFEGNNTYFDEEFERLSYSFPSHVFFSGPVLRNGAMALGMDIPGGEVLYNGIALDRFPATPKKPPGRGPLKVGILANISPRKNQHTAIEVMREGLGSGRYSLVLGGDEQYPDYAATVRATAEGLPVEFRGHVTDVVDFFNKVDVMLLSSTLEGWPIVIMEALACGVPVVAPSLSDTAVLLDNGKAGLLYGDGEYRAIPELLNSLRDSNTYERYAREGSRQCRRFDIRKKASILNEAIQNVVKQWPEKTHTEMS